jgi:hypothetical protein
MSGSIGDGIEDILNMGRGKHVSFKTHVFSLLDSVPTIVAFTKFDEVVALEGGSSARASARTRFEQSCLSLFRKEPRDVPAEIVSGNYSFMWNTPLMASLILSGTTIH